MTDSSGSGSFWQTPPSADAVADLQAMHHRLLAAASMESTRASWGVHAPRAHDACSLVDDDRLLRRVRVRRAAAGSGAADALVGEARARARIDLPGVPPVHELVMEQGFVHLVDGLAEGRSFADLLASPGELERWTLPALLRAVERVVDVLVATEQAGLVHGRVGAGAVRLGAHGEVWLDEWHEAQDGTDASVDRRGLARLLQDVTAAKPALPSELQAIVAHAAAGRYASNAALRADLRAFAEQRPVACVPHGVLASLWSWARRNRGTVAVVVLLALAIVIGTLVVLAAAARSAKTLAAERADAVAEQQRLEGLRDAWIVTDLRQRAGMLWPADDSALAAIDEWLTAAQGLASRRDQHRRRHAELDSRERTEAESWEHAALSSLLAAFATTDDEIAALRARRADAATLRERTVRGSTAAALWQPAIADIARSPIYRGLHLTPQLGLVPLWRDETTGLWWFHHVQSGEPPERAADGAVRMRPATGIVLVLLPGGTFAMGTHAVDEQHPRGTHNADPWHFAGEGPVHSIELAPFFIGCCEVTNTQWTARMPGLVPQQPSTMPANDLSWAEASEFCRRFHLQLPTEAQWEYAARGGTTGVYAFGDAPEGLARYGNIAGLEMQAAGIAVEPWDDGVRGNGPVDGMLPNPFGLFGNVSELCRDWYAPYSAPVRAGDGLRGEVGARQDVRIVRGSCAVHPATLARCGARQTVAPDYRAPGIGFRVVKAIE